MTILCLILLELCSGVAIFISHKYFGTPKRISVFKFHPLFTGQNIVRYESNWNKRLPVLGYSLRVHQSDECGLTTDKYGFIHNGNPNREIREDHFTIFILGGSTVAGHGSSCNDKTFAAVLEQKLRAVNPNIDVINAGVPGYYSVQEFHQLANEILYFKPDLVLIFDSINDFIYEPIEFEGLTNTYFISKYQAKLFNLLDQTNSFGWSARNFLYNATKFTEYTYTRFVLQYGMSFFMGKTGATWKNDLVTNVKREVKTKELPNNIPDYTDEGFEKMLDKKVNDYLHYIQMSRFISEASGVKFKYIIQPALYVDQKMMTEDEKYALSLIKYAFYNKYHYDVLKRADYYWKQLKFRAGELNVDYADFQDIFKGHNDVYIDNLHYTDNGNKIIADNLFKFLMESDLIEGKNN